MLGPRSYDTIEYLFCTFRHKPILGEGPTRDLDQILATYHKRLRAPRSGAFTREFGLKSLAMLGVQGVESYNKTGLEKLLVARLKEVFGGRHKKADVAVMIRYFEKKREQLGVGPGDHLYVSLRGRNLPPSDYFERPAVGRPRAGLTKEAGYRKYASPVLALCRVGVSKPGCQPFAPRG